MHSDSSSIPHAIVHSSLLAPEASIHKWYTSLTTQACILYFPATLTSKIITESELFSCLGALSTTNSFATHYKHNGDFWRPLVTRNRGPLGRFSPKRIFLPIIMLTISVIA
jgi:hypothetical protein